MAHAPPATALERRRTGPVGAAAASSTPGDSIQAGAIAPAPIAAAAREQIAPSDAVGQRVERRLRLLPRHALAPPADE